MKALKNMEYPGRFIGLGKRADGKKIIALYGITGRSESSQNRKMIAKGEDDVITWSVNVRNKKNADKKQLPLLVYDSLITKNYDTLVISNGAQTNLLAKFMDQYNDPQALLIRTMSVERDSTINKNEYMQKVKDGEDINLTWYEPDKPIHTPRIFGAIKDDKISLGIAKKDKVSIFPSYFYSSSIPMNPGEGKLIATYNGDRKNPKPFGYGSGNLKLLDIELRGSIGDIAYGAWNAMNPEYRVILGCMFVDPTNKTLESKIIDRYQNGERI